MDDFHVRRRRDDTAPSGLHIGLEEHLNSALKNRSYARTIIRQLFYPYQFGHRTAWGSRLPRSISTAILAWFHPVGLTFTILKAYDRWQMWKNWVYISAGELCKLWPGYALEPSLGSSLMPVKEIMLEVVEDRTVKVNNNKWLQFLSITGISQSYILIWYICYDTASVERVHT